MPHPTVVVVEVQETLAISVAVPEGAGDEAARAVALHAARTFSHVSHDSISAFNEIHRLHPQGAGVVTQVEARTHAG